MVLNTCFFTRGPHEISPGVRGKAGFTHESGDFSPDASGKRFSAHGAEERRGAVEERRGLSKKSDIPLARKRKKTGRALRPTCFHQVTVGKH